MKYSMTLTLTTLLTLVPNLHLWGQYYGTCRNECVDCCYVKFSEHSNEMMDDYVNDVIDCMSFTTDPSFYRNMWEAYTSQGKDIMAYVDYLRSLDQALSCVSEADSDKDRQVTMMGEAWSDCMDACGCYGCCN